MPRPHLTSPLPPLCSDLIELINGDLSKNDRKKLITLCTIDVHARDVVQRLIDERVENAQCFQWSSQLRYYQNEKTKECQVCQARAWLAALERQQRTQGAAAG